MAYLSHGVGNYYLPQAFGGGIDLAIKDFRRAIELNPKNADAWLWLGVALRRSNQPAEAQKAFEQVARNQSKPRLGQTTARKNTRLLTTSPTETIALLNSLTAGVEAMPGTLQDYAQAVHDVITVAAMLNKAFAVRRTPSTIPPSRRCFSNTPRNGLSSPSNCRQR